MTVSVRDDAETPVAEMQPSLDQMMTPPVAPLAMPKQVLEHRRGALLGGLLALFGRNSTRSSQG